MLLALGLPKQSCLDSSPKKQKENEQSCSSNPFLFCPGALRWHCQTTFCTSRPKKIIFKSQDQEGAVRNFKAPDLSVRGRTKLQLGLDPLPWRVQIKEGVKNQLCSKVTPKGSHSATVITYSVFQMNGLVPSGAAEPSPPASFPSLDAPLTSLRRARHSSR